MKSAELEVLFISFACILSKGKILIFKERTLSRLLSFCNGLARTNVESSQLSGPKTTKYWCLLVLKETL